MTKTKIKSRENGMKLKHPPDFLFFWERGCENCEIAYPALEKAIRKKSLEVNLYTYRVSEHPRLVKWYEIKGTPTLVIDDGIYEPVLIEGCLTTKSYMKHINRWMAGWRLY